MTINARAHLIGIDQLTAKPLAAAVDPQAVLRDQASNHERNRLESVAETMALVGAMTFQKVLSGREQVRVARAVFQFGRGVLEDNTVAAHCLPGAARI
jgi:hypothetical protein